MSTSQHSILDMDIEEDIKEQVLEPLNKQGSWYPLQASRNDFSTPLQAGSAFSKEIADLHLEVEQLKREVLRDNSSRVSDIGVVDRSAQMFAQTLREEFSKLPAKFSSPAYKERKLRSFWGEGGDSIEDFIEEAKLLIEGRNWSPQEEGRFVMSHLEGEARREIKACGKGWDTAEDLFKILRSAFGESRSIPALFSAFAERKQSGKEGVRSYCTDLYERFSRLVKRQVELGRTITSEEVLIDYFIEGLVDRTLVMEIRRHIATRNLTFAELREIAMDWEVIQRPGSKKAFKPPCDVEAIEIVNNDQRVAELEAELKKLRRLVSEKFNGDTPSEGQSGTRDPNRGHSGAPNQGTVGFNHTKFKFTSDGRPICAHCLAPGHVQRFCPKRRNTNRPLNGNPSE